MIDNENKNINGESEEVSGEAAKAFSWGWREEEPKPENPAEESPAEEAPAEEAPVEEAPVEEAPAEEKPEEKHEEKPEENPEDKNEETKEETAEKPREKKAEKKNFTLGLASILSACSIILLLAFGALVALGVFPFGRGNIVNIGVSGLGQTQPGTEASTDLLEGVFDSVVVVWMSNETSIGMGAGIIISEDGYIVTNYHIVGDADEVWVELYGKEGRIDAEVVGYKAEDDLAVIKINKTGLRPATFAKTSDVRYGERIYAIGHPQSSEFKWSVAEGIVSCPLRQIMLYDDDGVLERKMNVVQTDADINHGNSGGPIVNVRGEIVGMITLRRTDAVGLGFALPADGMLIDIAAIIKTGSADGVDSGISVPRPLIGITGVGVVEGNYYETVVTDGQSGVKVVDEEYAKANPKTTFYAPVTGVHVSLTSPGSDAAKHLKVNDVITKVNGITVRSIYEVMDIVNQFNGGDKVTVTYYRDGEYSTVELTLKTGKEIG